MTSRPAAAGQPAALASTEKASAELSVVVTVTADGTQVDGCLRALVSQIDPPPLEILAPVDPGLDDQERWRAEHPSVRFIGLPFDSRGTHKGSHDPALEHLACDRRRAAGLAAARAPVIALTDDHARPDPHWCRRIVEAHRRWPHVVIGGAIENGSDRLINRAVHLSDFGRYQAPLSEGSVRYLSDVNVSYKREALERVASCWRGSYHETAVHGALLAAGETLWLCPDIVVRRVREPVSMRQALRERFAWGRLYAGKRVTGIATKRRIAMAVLAPLLPPVLVARHLRVAFGRGRAALPFLRALPALTVLESVWSLGELVGYWTGRAVPGS